MRINILGMGFTNGLFHISICGILANKMPNPKSLFAFGTSYALTKKGDRDKLVLFIEVFGFIKYFILKTYDRVLKDA